MARRETGRAGRVIDPALQGAPSDASHFDFLRPTRACIGAPRIPGFCLVGFVWNSLDSLVRNEPFQWVTRDPGPIFNSLGPSPEAEDAMLRPSFDPKVDHAETH